MMVGEQKTKVQDAPKESLAGLPRSGTMEGCTKLKPYKIVNPPLSKLYCPRHT